MHMPAYEFVKENTLAGLLIERAAQMPNFVFAIFPDETASFKVLLDRAEALAKGLLASGLRSGDHVAILMPNCLDYMVAHYAIQLAGGVSVLLNARFKSYELANIVGHCDAKMLITTSRFESSVNYCNVLVQTFPVLAQANAGQPIKIDAAPLLQKIILFGDKTTWAAANRAKEIVSLGMHIPVTDLEAARRWQAIEKTAVLYYTSGTTSMPKACEISHAALQRSWSIFARTVGLRAGEKVWVPMPFFHSGGIGLMTGLMAHGAAMASAAYFDPAAVLAMVEAHRVEHLYPGFHLLAAPVLHSPQYDVARFGFIRTLVVIGPLGTLRALQTLLPPGIPALNLYGMSEAAGLITLALYNDTEDLRLTTVGKPLPGIEVRICHLETGEVLANSQTGEIQFRGGGAFAGYYKDEVATRETIMPDGWIRTGDQGYLDEEGYLYFLGRLKDVLRIGGENVAAGEIESFLSAHPAVANVQIIGRPDHRMGELPVAFIELTPGHAVSAQELIDFCAGKIARYKVPREIVFVTPSQWPMSATKIQKFKLKKLLPPTIGPPRES